MTEGMINQNTEDHGPGLDEALGVASLAGEVFHLAKKKLGAERFFNEIPGFAKGAILAKLMLAVIGSAEAHTSINVDGMADTLHGVVQQNLKEQIQRGNEAYQANAADVDVQFQAFLDKIRPDVEEVRMLFGAQPSAPQERAIRFAFADIIGNDDELAVRGLYLANNFDARLAEVLGGPLQIDDILEKEFMLQHPEERAARAKFNGASQTPTPLDDLNPDGTPKQMGIDLRRYRPAMSLEYAQFVTALADIIHSAPFENLRELVGDKGQLIAMEMLMNPKFFTPEEVEWAKGHVKLGEGLDLLHPEIMTKSLT